MFSFKCLSYYQAAHKEPMFSKRKIDPARGSCKISHRPVILEGHKCASVNAFKDGLTTSPTSTPENKRVKIEPNPKNGHPLQNYAHRPNTTGNGRSLLQSSQPQRLVPIPPQTHRRPAAGPRQVLAGYRISAGVQSAKLPPMTRPRSLPVFVTVLALAYPILASPRSVKLVRSVAVYRVNHGVLLEPFYGPSESKP
jgi:hypothetical protein